MGRFPGQTLVRGAPMVRPEDVEEYRTVILAAFLHDIGKLLGRGSFEMLDKGQHPKFSADFVNAFKQVFAQIADADLLKELVQKHHQNQRAFPPEFLVQSISDDQWRTLATLVSKADNLSSSERGEASEQYQDYKTTPLCSVIERVDTKSDGGLRLRFHPKALSQTTATDMRETLFPAEFTEYQSGEMNKLIQAFGSAFGEFVKTSGGSVDFERLASHLSNLVYTHTWCIPSNTQEEVPDVSLYDHLKTTAAIAGCLYLYHSGTGSLDERSVAAASSPRFIIATGDLSGIQGYIFDITSSVAGGVARRLRARSLFVQLCSEVAAHRILHQLGLPLWNILMNAGGNFYLLLPNLPEATTVLAETQKEIDRWFMHNLNGELALNLAYYAFDDGGFKPGATPGSGFSRVVYEVKTRLGESKQNRFQHILQDKGSWQEHDFVVPICFQGKTACQSCHKYPAEAANGLCLNCEQEGEVGTRMPRAKYISFFRDEKTGRLPVLGYSVSVESQSPEAQGPYLVMKLNDTDLRDVAAHPSMSRYLATHVPQDGGQTRTFEDIARQADGQPLLGFLKADVDRLGELFIFGLKRETNPVDTMSRQSALSRLLETFFTGWLESLVSTQFPNCYTVFSGGDDLFLLGPWNQMLSLAEQISADFGRFTGNPQVTISAGIAITRRDYPVARVAEMVSHALDKSKQAGRDRITIFDRTLTWREWSEVSKEWDYLRNIASDSSRVPSAFLYNLLDFADMWQRYRGGDILGLRYHPLLAYNITRNLDARRAPGLYDWTTRLLKWPPGDREQMLLDNLGLITMLCLYSRRGGRQ